MTIPTFTALVALGSFVAGFLGAMTGLGGGVIIVPLLVIGFGIDMPYAIGASLVAVIATSTGAASSYVRQGYTNIRLAMLLEVGTTIGGLAGAVVVALAFVPIEVLTVLFGLVLLVSACISLFSISAWRPRRRPEPLATWFQLDGCVPDSTGPQPYHLQRVRLGFALMLLAGLVSGLLGIGSGAIKVLVLDQIMKAPFKVATTTTNFMTGVTATASAAVYLGRGYIDPGLALPVVLGVLGGAVLGAKMLTKVGTKALRGLFIVVIVVLGVQMIWKGISGVL